MIVFIGGMMRSGSTFSFNVARSLLAARGTLHHEPSSELLDILERADAVDHVLFKAHALDRLTANLTRLRLIKTILTVRRPEDSIASLVRTFSIPPSEGIEITRRWLTTVAPLSSEGLLIQYEDVDQRPESVIRNIAGYLGLDADAEEVARIGRENNKAHVKSRYDQLAETDPGVKSIGFSHYHEETYYHRRHVSSLESMPAEALLPPETLRAIRMALAPFIDVNGELALKAA